MTPSETYPDQTILLSVVIPVFNEEPRMLPALERLRGWAETEIVVVVDPGTSDASAQRAASVPGVRVITACEPGRGSALRDGAHAARGPFLLFLHADSCLPETAVRTAMTRLRGGTVAAAFEIRLDSPRRVFRLLELGINLRSRLFSLPYGDQGLLISKEALERAGGFRPLPRCEDLDLVLRLRKLGRIALVPGPCLTSTRRWDREGVLSVTISNLAALARFVTTGKIPDGAMTHVSQSEASGVDPDSNGVPVDRGVDRGVVRG